jgi:hypothetical protein
MMKYTSLLWFVIVFLSFNVASYAQDIIVSIGELGTQGVCDTAESPIVVPVGTQKDVPINICDELARDIYTAQFEITYDDSVIDIVNYNLGPVVPVGWFIDGGKIGTNPGVYSVGLFEMTGGPITITEGVILNLTFASVGLDPQATSNVTFSKVILEDDLGTAFPVSLVNNDAALPATYSTLGAIQHMREGIKIFWEVESQQENLGWNIYRSETKDGKFVKINGKLIDGAGTKSTPMKYSFIDKDAEKGKIYYYYLEDISFNGEKHRTKVIRTTSVNKATSWGNIKRSALR